MTDWTSRFIGMCCSIITVAAVGIFNKTSATAEDVAVIKAQMAQNREQTSSLRVDIDGIKSQILTLNLEIVRVKASNESWSRRFKKKSGNLSDD